ncbi:MAG: S8 family serine peptidase [Deltaproteobacteria bacterium]|nr:S8 family serine peptidase [Deltaproteobacteria bacterium]
MLKDLAVVGIKGLSIRSDIFLETLRYAKTKGVKVINMSFGMELEPSIPYFSDVDETKEGFWIALADWDDKKLGLAVNLFRKELDDPTLSFSTLKDMLDMIRSKLKSNYAKMIQGANEIKTQENDILIVTAAGNDHSHLETMPLMVPQNFYALGNVIVVAAATQDGHLSPYSNWHPERVHVAAIADELVMLEPQNKQTKRITTGGTSAATAQVSKLAGVIYHLFSQHGFDIQKIKPILVKTLILRTAAPKDRLKGKVQTGGLIDPKRAIETVEKIIQRFPPTKELRVEDIESFF